MVNNNKRLFRAYKEEYKQNVRLQHKKQQYNLDMSENNIIIEKNNNILLKTLILICEILRNIIKFVFIAIFILLVTIGSTILINPNLRNQFFDIIVKAV